MIILDDTWMPKTTTFSEGYVRYHRNGDEEIFYPTDHNGKKQNGTVHFYVKHNRRIISRSIRPIEGIVIITEQVTLNNILRI